MRDRIHRAILVVGAVNDMATWTCQGVCPEGDSVDDLVCHDTPNGATAVSSGTMMSLDNETLKKGLEATMIRCPSVRRADGEQDRTVSIGVCQFLADPVQRNSQSRPKERRQDARTPSGREIWSSLDNKLDNMTTYGPLKCP